MINFAQGKQLGTGDLNIIIRDESGSLYDPAQITYSIFAIDPISKADVLVTLPNTVPVKDDGSNGIFHVAMTIPTTWEGSYKLIWYITRYAGGSYDTLYEEFQVTNFDPARASYEASSVMMVQKPGISAQTARLVMMVRELLSDTNPDRNYHFRPPTSGKVIAGFSARVGFIWTDDTIIRLLQLALNQMNWINPLNVYSYDLNNVPESWAMIACLGAAAKCLSSEASRWAAEEFGYSLNGVSLDINKASTYQSLASAYADEFKEMATQAALNRPFSAGLRQQRFLI